MRTILTKIAKLYILSEDGRSGLVHFLEMKKHPGWQTHKGFLLHMGNLLANEVIGAKFQQLPEKEKLVRLEAYSMLSEAIKFLLDPMPEMTRVSAIQQRTREVTPPGKRPKKGA